MLNAYHRPDDEDLFIWCIAKTWKRVSFLRCSQVGRQSSFVVRFFLAAAAVAAAAMVVHELICD